MKQNFSLFLLLLLSISLFANDQLTVVRDGDHISLSNSELSLDFESSAQSFKLLDFSSPGKMWSVHKDQDMIWQLMLVNTAGHPIIVNPRNSAYKGVEVLEEQGKKS